MDHLARSARMARSIAAACLVMVSAVACGSDNDSPYASSVGLACRGDFDCAPGVRCDDGQDVGDGTCAYPCRDHFDCPGGAACVDVQGGTCLPGCTDDSWCLPGYHCKRRPDRVRPGDSFVCVK